MPKFRYTAVDAEGNEKSDVLEADNAARAGAMVRDRGLYPTSVTEIKGRGAGGGAAGGKRARSGGGDKAPGFLSMELRLPGFLEGLFRARVKPKQLTIVTRQLATLVDAGLPLLRSLQALLKQEKNATLRRSLSGIGDDVMGGSTFAEALAHHPRVFNRLYVNMVKAGEAGGVLEVVLNRLAEFMEKAERIKNKVRGAMVYPTVVLVMALFILTFLMIFIIPKFAEIFDDLLEGGRLPGLTQFVMGVSDLFVERWVLVIGFLAGVVVAFKLLAATKWGSAFLDAFKLRAPVFGPLIRKRAVANFTRTLGTLLTSGVPILQALNIVKETAGNAVISRAIDRVHDAVKEGDSMVMPLEASGVFPTMVISMIDVGEETGKLPEMLTKIADTYDDEVDTAVEALTSILEPLMIIVLAVVVGVIVVAMFLPLVEIIKRLT